jgi:hypothetical protein
MTPDKERDGSIAEGPEERATRLCDWLFGLRKEEIAAHGGTEGFINWVRSRDEDTEVDIWLRNKDRKS